MKVIFEFDTESENFNSIELERHKQANDMAKALKVLAYSVLSCLSTLFLVAYAELNPAVRAPGNKLSISFLVFSYWIFQSFIKVLYCSSLVFFNFISSLSVFFNLFFISSYETLSSSFKPSIYVSFPVSSSVSEYPKTSLYSDEISFLLFMIS